MSGDEPRRSVRANKGQHNKNASSSPGPTPKPTKAAKGKGNKKQAEAEVEEQEEEEEVTVPSLSDGKPFPRPFESLREFFARTSTEWQELLLRQLQEIDTTMGLGKSVKEIRKEAFSMADKKWWDCREEIQALEDQQEDSGIGELVSLTDKGDQADGLGRRR